MSVEVGKYVKLTPDSDIIGRFFTLREIQEFLDACHAAGGRPSDFFRLSSGEFRVPTEEERAKR